MLRQLWVRLLAGEIVGVKRADFADTAYGVVTVVAVGRQGFQFFLTCPLKKTIIVVVYIWGVVYKGGIGWFPQDRGG